MNLKRSGIKLSADSTRVLLQPFTIGNETRIKKVVQRVLSLTEEKSAELLDKIYVEFKDRHLNFEQKLDEHFELIKKYVPVEVSTAKRRLLGAYFSKEYSVESAALFNPSIVRHPQARAGDKELKFILSLRATGEGHISSIEFRSGKITAEGDVNIDEYSRFITSPQSRNLNPAIKHHVDTDKIDANYDIEFSGDEKISERVIFPYSRTECNGIEDVRFVRFMNENGTHIYYGTFTAYDGHRILSEIIETKDFKKFKIRTFSGSGAKDKGMALFPRKIKGQYMMISRQDGENIFIMKSDNLYEWNNPEVLREPKLNWEFIQLGNCGSPIETSEGWILLTHAVGTMRTYVLSALLLDLENPQIIKGWLEEPLLKANADEREGYVSNVVYSCGGVLHNNNLILPYAMSDTASSFATIPLDDLLKSFKRI